MEGLGLRFEVWIRGLWGDLQQTDEEYGGDLKFALHGHLEFPDDALGE